MHQLIVICGNHCKRLARLVDDVLDVQKMDAGLMRIHARAQPVLPLLDEAARTMRGAASLAGVQIAVDPGPQPGLAAAIDVDRMMQVTTDLLSNAIKFSPAGGVITLRLASENGKTGIQVVDQGPDSPVAQRDRGFQPFVQWTDSQGRGQRHGTGPGLSVSRRIVEDHGGALVVRDGVHGGPLFNIITGKHHDARRQQLLNLLNVSTLLIKIVCV